MQVGLWCVPSTNLVDYDDVEVVCQCDVHLGHMFQYMYGRTGHLLSKEVWIASEG